MEQENIIQQEQIVEQPEVQEQQINQEQRAQQESVVDERERNFAALREARERAERERDDAINYIRQLQQSQQPQYAQQEDADEGLAPDDLVEWKHVDKKIKKLESKINQYEQYNAATMAEARVKTSFPDFDQVVTNESVEALRRSHPEIAQSLHATPDLYNKAASTYNIIKRFGLNNHNPQAEYDRQLVAKNHSKPRPTNAVSPQQGETPLNRANEFATGVLTEERRRQLYKEMMEAKNNW